MLTIMIQLIGELHCELTGLGLKSGDVIRNHTKPDKRGAIYFDIYYNGTIQSCVVWSNNYEIQPSVGKSDTK